MLRSFEYREIEWSVPKEKHCLLEIELQKQSRQGTKDKMNIMTKQVCKGLNILNHCNQCPVCLFLGFIFIFLLQNGLIYHLMCKLSSSQTG